MMEEVVDRVAPVILSVRLPLLLLVVTAAPFKLLIRAEGVLLGVATRFLRALVSSVPGLTLELRLMLSCGEAEVDAPDAVSEVMDAPCD